MADDREELKTTVTGQPMRETIILGHWFCERGSCRCEFSVL